MHKLLSHLSDRSSFRGLLFIIVCMVTMSGVPELSAQRVEVDDSMRSHYSSVISGSGSSIRTYWTNGYNLEQEREVSGIAWKRRVFENDLSMNRIEHTFDNIRIAVVFHIIEHKESDIHEEYVHRQISILNEAFNQIRPTHEIFKLYADHWDYKPGSANIQFEIANRIDGLEGGIIRVRQDNWGEVMRKNDVSMLDLHIKNKDYGGSPPISPEQIVNIWVVDLAEGLAGYAQWPGGDAHRDGIVINSQYLVGKNERFNRGMTLVHLVGSYLGLIELWGKYSTVCDDDLVADTPVHNAPNGTPTGTIHLSLCNNKLALMNNYMDNTDDEFVDHFTEGQVYRMRQFLNRGGLRAGLSK